MTLNSGTKLGPYEVVSLIGAGGMGEVYRARDARLGRDVAIQGSIGIVRPRPGALASVRARCAGGSRAEPPEHLGLYDIGTQNGSYLVSELLEGESLRATS